MPRKGTLEQISGTEVRGGGRIKNRGRGLCSSIAVDGSTEEKVAAMDKRLANVASFSHFPQLLRPSSATGTL